MITLVFAWVQFVLCVLLIGVAGPSLCRHASTVGWNDAGLLGGYLLNAVALYLGR